MKFLRVGGMQACTEAAAEVEAASSVPHQDCKSGSAAGVCDELRLVMMFVLLRGTFQGSALTT